MNPIKTILLAALTVLALAAALPAAAATGPMLHAKADPKRPPADEYGERPDPYIAFALTGAKPGSRYRIVVEDSPRAGKVPCNTGLISSWTPTLPGGHVVFDLLPVTSGHYFPFAGNQPCKGSYVLQLDEKRNGDWDTIRRFAFRYPSFSVSPLPLAH